MTNEEDSKLQAALENHLPQLAADSIYEALSDWMEAHKQDNRDQINRTGDYDPDY